MIVEVKPHWEEEWQRGEIPITPSTHEWIVSRPAPIRELMIRFPPSCLVRTILPDCRCPKPNTVGIVSSYIMPELGTPQGMVTVIQHPGAAVRAECTPGSLVLVGFHKNLTTDLIRRILATHGL